jgi:hypothetical protein
MPLEPRLKPDVFGRPIIYNGRDDFVFAQTRYDIQTFLSFARAFHDYTHSSRRTRTFPNDMTLYSALVNVCNNCRTGTSASLQARIAGGYK